MEKQSKMSNKKKQGFESRSPLQNLNGLQLQKPNSKKTSNLSSSSSSSSSSVCNEAQQGLSRLLISSNSIKKPTNLSMKSSPLTLKPRSKENEVPKKPLSLKKQPSCLERRKQFGKANTKPIFKTAPKSNLCSAHANPVKIFKKGSQKLETGLKNSQDYDSGELPIKHYEVPIRSNFDRIESYTPAGKKANACGLVSVSFDYCRNVEEGSSISNSGNGKNSETAVKTPPVEASVSPEIQCGPHSKMLASRSSATPVCYGAGHLLSGVTDKRKCRRRGSLKGGCEKINLFDDDVKKNDANVISDLRDSLVPLPAEASVRWLLSPCDEELEGHKNDLEKKVDQSKMIGEGDCVETDLLSSPLMLCEDVTNPNCDSNCNNSVGLGVGISVKNIVNENSSAFSLGSLSGGNIIQTPSSDASSYGHRGVSFVRFELDSVTKTLNKVDLSGLSLQSSDMDLSSSISLTQLYENVDSVGSWVSDSTMENLTLSQTRISWRDGSISRIDENDEFDCCRCLSDEEIDANEFSDKKMYKEENDMRICNDVSPSDLAGGKKNLSPRRVNASAESICTNGGDLVASGDSDWIYYRENHLYQVK